MYGVVNKAIEDLILGNHGKDAWRAVKAKAGVDIEVFVSNEPYPDDITYNLVGAASQVLGAPTRDILIAFGEHWVLRTGSDYYGVLLRASGSLKNFLLGLPDFHSRVQLFYPRLTPPEFACTDIGERSLRLHYFTRREGLSDFVVGLVQGLGKIYGTPATATLVASKAAGDDHDIFLITWASAAT